MSIDNTNRVQITAVAECAWIHRADNEHRKLRPFSNEYKKLEVEFFAGVMTILQLAALLDKSGNANQTVPDHWIMRNSQNLNIVEPYRIDRLHKSSLIERATKIIDHVLPADEHVNIMAAAYIDNGSLAFKEYVQSLPMGQ